MIFTDTHTHLYAEEFNDDRFEMVQRAIDVGVSRFFIPSINSDFTDKMYELEAAFPDNIRLMIGLHPCYVKDNYLDELAHVEAQLAKHQFFAIGEIGIDLYWDKTTLDIQKIAFQRQIQMAKKHKLAINIHCRDAFDEVFDVLELEKSPDLYGIFHCFSGNLEQAQRAISLGLKLGIGGVATFKNGKIDQFLSQISLEHIVLETDAPYLAPAPHRGKRNESSYTVLVAEKLALIYDVTIEEIAQITTENSKAIFGI